MLSTWIISQLMLIGIFNAGDAVYCGTPVRLSDRRRFNYLVEIIHFDDDDFGYCGGAIIDSTHILTAAHCFFDPFDGEAVIIAGVVHLNSIARIERTVSKIHVHEKYNFLGFACKTWARFKKWINTACQCIKDESDRFDIVNDIAVLTLSEALPVGEYVNVVNLPDTDFLPRCNYCDYAGWGQTEQNGPLSMWLFSTQLMLLTDRDCRTLHTKHAFKQFCAMDPAEEACPLKGDSGAPLVFNNTVYGVSSTGRKHPSYPNIFTKVFDHLDFIRKALDD